MNIVVGVDEAGTGAWAASFHVGCVACDIVPFNSAIGRYLKDSKAMTEHTRARAVPHIKEHALAWQVVAAPLKAIAKNHKQAWREAVSTAVGEVVSKLPEDARYRVIIDGTHDVALARWLRKRGIRPIFQHRADDRFPAVMAAAILAKTTRDAMMLELDQQYPAFGWARNKGYGTQEHLEACERVGVTEHHRPIGRLRSCMPYDPEEAQRWWSIDGGS